MLARSSRARGSAENKNWSFYAIYTANRCDEGIWRGRGRTISMFSSDMAHAVSRGGTARLLPDSLCADYICLRA